MRARIGGWNFLRQLYQNWNDDALGDTAAALTYYAMLALFPFLLFLVTLAGLLLNPSVIARLVDQLAGVAPPQVSQIVDDRLRSLQQSHSSVPLTLLGIVGAVWAASGAVSSLMQALNRCYDVHETRPFWKTRGLSIVVTLVAGAVTVLAAIAMFGLPAVGAYLGGKVGTLLWWLRFPVGGLMAMLAWALLFRLLPNVRPKFHLVTPGSIVAVILWLLASWGFAEYVRHFGSYEKSYGTLGGVIVLLVWMWISSAVVLLGAEVNKILTPEEKILREAITSELRRDGKTPPVVATQPRRAPDGEPTPSPSG